MTRLLGFDINHWKHPVPIQTLVEEHGAKYIIGKVTDGVYYKPDYITLGILDINNKKT